MYALQITASNTMKLIIFHENWVGIYGYLYTFSLTLVISVLCAINSAYGLWPIKNSHLIHVYQHYIVVKIMLINLE